MITNVHNYRGVLPEKRVELYAEICDVLLGHWRQAKGVNDRLTAPQRRKVLQPLAEAMMTRRLRGISTHEALDVIGPQLTQIGVIDQEVPGFLNDVQSSSGLLLETESGVWSFAHLTFQEYLCAAHWDKTGKVADWKNGQWGSYVDDGWWHETLRLYAAQSDANPLVNACLRINTPSALRLAANIATEALRLEPDVRKQMMKYLNKLTVHLRDTPVTISKDEAEKVFRVNKSWQPLEYLRNDYEDRGPVIMDHATGLMWQKSGSDYWLPYDEARHYIQKLNREQFAGWDDWRLPTIDELLSLLEPEEHANNVFMNPLFDSQQWWCWSVDTTGAFGVAWYVSFRECTVGWYELSLYVRAVRS